MRARGKWVEGSLHRLVAATLIGALLQGCSFAMTQAPPVRPHAQWEKGFACNESYMAPVADVLGFGLFGAGTGWAVTEAMKGKDGAVGSVALLGAGAVAFAISSGMGFSRVASCSTERAAWAELHPGMPNPPPPVLPKPPPAPPTRYVVEVTGARSGDPKAAFDQALRVLVVIGFGLEQKDRDAGVIQTAWTRTQDGGVGRSHRMTLSVVVTDATYLVRPRVQHCFNLTCVDALELTKVEADAVDRLVEALTAAPPAATTPSAAPPSEAAVP